MATPVVYAQTWQVLTLKNCIEPFSNTSTAYVVASALVSVRLFCKNLSNLQKFFGQMVYRPPGRKQPVRLWKETISRLRLKTYTCIVLTDVQHTRLYPFQP